MTWFRDFNIPLWEVFGGNLLLVATLVFYIAWWTAAFRPNADGKTTRAGFFLIVALFARWLRSRSWSSVPKRCPRSEKASR
jgi:hypothetical protein